MIHLDDKNKSILHAIFKTHAMFDHAYYFGSRIDGTHRPNSDVDICIKYPIETTALSNLKESISNSDFPLKTDVIVWDTISTKFQNIIQNSLTPMNQT